MEFMSCGSCSGLCQVNGTGICLSCQRGFTNTPQEDSWVRSPDREKMKLEARKEEIEKEIIENSDTTDKNKKHPSRRKRASSVKQFQKSD